MQREKLQKDTYSIISILKFKICKNTIYCLWIHNYNIKTCMEMIHQIQNSGYWEERGRKRGLQIYL